ncbi:hypothetical protein AC1031_020600 [Aphanomyces cochlioides]|nr:hypothetical protein AC1031_020600 [Aphanomyces cochlioides]
MRALFLVKRVTDFNQPDLASCFEVREIDTPKPKYGEVLVKVECSPINPSNLMMLQGTYDNSAETPLPCLLGGEGSGTVVASGGGWMPWFMIGKRVGIWNFASGLWAEYVTVDAMSCVSLPDDVSFEEGSSCFVNPLTVVGFVEIALARGVKAIVHTAGASALGKMLVKHAKEHNVDVIAVVRRADQVESLKAIGAKYIVNTSDADWKDQLKNMSSELGATLGFDAVGGSLTGEVLECMPNGSDLQVYGALSGQPSSALNAKSFIFQGKKVSGFWLGPYMQTRGTLGLLSMFRKVSNGLKTSFATSINKTYALEDAARATREYSSNMSDNKVGFKPTLTL